LTAPGAVAPGAPPIDFMRIQPDDLLTKPPVAPGPRGQRSGASLREEFAALEGSMNRVATLQGRSLDALVRVAQGRVSLIRTSIGELGLEADRFGGPPPRPDPAARPSSRRGREMPIQLRDPFEVGLQNVKLGFAQVEALRPALQKVPLRRPLESGFGMSSNFGPRSDPFTGATAMHAGIDFRGATGTPVRAAGSGRVAVAGVAGGYGNLVEIDHGNGVATRYAHLSEIAVVVGQTVEAATVVGAVGSTGRSTGPHLHYETRVAGTPLDPTRFLRIGARLLGAEYGGSLSDFQSGDGSVAD
jgi:murein DD-endopeptidase MepM/ murein hydrolase activator NlpD